MGGLLSQTSSIPFIPFILDQFNLDERKIELALMDRFVRGDIDVT